MSLLTRRALLGSAFFAGMTVGAAAQGLSQRPPIKPAPDSGDLIAKANLPGKVSYALYDPAKNLMLEQGLASAQRPPASTLKTITALYALDKLGADYRFKTRVLAAGDMLILAGGGDPVLSTDDLATLAGDLVATGQETPKRFAVWGGALPKLAEISPPQEDYVAYNPAMSGMILNFNRVHLGWRRAGSGYDMSLEARAARNSPRAYTITASPAVQNDLFSYEFQDNREIWSVSRAAMGRAGSRWLPVRHPELYAGDVFQTLCRAKGLVLPTPEVIDSLPDATEIVTHESPPLTEILRDLLYYSTNLTAEVVGLKASGATDLPASGAMMKDWLLGQGIADEFLFADHSGLSAESRVTAAGMVRVLAGPGLKFNLPDLLKDDPLGARGQGIAKVSAKTGTLNFVSNLAGYATAPSGRRLAFALLCIDTPRHVASEGKELPAGVLSWTRDAKRLQYNMIEAWAQKFG